MGTDATSVDAFSVLKASSKRSRPPASPKPAAAASKQRKPVTPGQQTLAGAVPPAGAPSPHDSRRPAGSEKPSVLDGVAPARQSSPAATTKSTPPPQQLPSAAPAAQPDPAKPNAFSVLKASAAAKFERHHFFGGIVDGLWRAAIWRAGTATPDGIPAGPWPWTATVKVAVPVFTASPQPHDSEKPPTKSARATRQVELQLCSNLASAEEPNASTQPGTAAGAALRQALLQQRAPSEPEYVGGVPLLKSALQARTFRDASSAHAHCITLQEPLGMCVRTTIDP